MLKAAKETELSTCAVAPHQVYGPSDRLFLPSLLKNARKGTLRVMGYGQNCVSFTHESNIAHALLLAAGALVAHEDWKKAGCPNEGKIATFGKAGAKVNGEYMVVTDATDEYPAGKLNSLFFFFWLLRTVPCTISYLSIIIFFFIWIFFSFLLYFYKNTKKRSRN